MGHIFKGGKRATPVIMSDAEKKLLIRENREAVRGGMNPFALNSGPDATTKLLEVNLKMNTPTGIIGNSSYFEPEEIANE